MNKKIIYSLLIILVVLLVVYFAQKSFDSAARKPQSLSELKLEFDPENVTRIDVYKQDFPDSGLHFSKLESGWVVVNAYNSLAKEQDVVKLLTELGEVSGSVRGETADLYEDFDIADEEALQIELFDSEDAKLLHVYVGKGGSGGRDCFLRVVGSPVVYLADNNFISRFAAWNSPPEKKLPIDRWVKLELCDIDRNDLTSFTIHKGEIDHEFGNIDVPSEDTLLPPEKAWTQISPQEGLKLEESKIKSLYSGLAGLRASGVVAPANRDKYGLDKPKYSLRAGDDVGNSAAIYFSDEVNDDGDRYAVVEGRESVYEVNSSTFERFFIKPFESLK